MRVCQYRLSLDSPVAFIVKIVKVLGEGGFSFVYLAQDELSGVSNISIEVLSINSEYPAAIRVEENTMSDWL